MSTLVSKGPRFPGLYSRFQSHQWLDRLFACLFKAIEIVYTSFHFCGVFCPVVCGCRVHPFCTLVGGHRLSRAPSSAAGPPPADESCQPPCTKRKCVPLRHPPGQNRDPGLLHRERQLYLEMTVPPSQGAAGKIPHQTESRFPPSHLSPALSCRSYRLPISFHLVEL